MPRIYWSTPTLILGSLLLGATIAFGHHVFYNSLHRTPAPTTFDEYTILGTRISSQQANIAIGTAFAFMAKACLVFAVSLSYLQAVFWNVMSSTPVTTVASMDVLMSALGNWLALGQMSTWWRRPILLLVAVVAWTIPIASIIAPATLSIGNEISPAELRRVPAVAFDSLNLVSEMPFMSAIGTDRVCPHCVQAVNNLQAYYAYNGPNIAVRKTAVASAAQGQILPIEAPAANSSWTTQFHGPTLQCQPVPSKLEREIQDSILESILASGDCSYGPGYIAWHPYRISSSSTIQDLLPFVRGPLDKDSDPLRLNHRQYSAQYNDDATIFVAVTPSLMASTVTGTGSSMPYGCPYNQDGATPPTSLEGYWERFFGKSAPQSTILRCEVHNSTYNTAFKFINGGQHVDVEITDVEEQPLVTEWAIKSLWNNASLYDDFQTPHPCNHFNSYNPHSMYRAACSFNITELQALSYQAIMDAFTELLSGTVEWVFNDEAGMSMNMNSTVASTVLTLSPELAFLESSDLINNGSRPTLQQIKPNWTGSFFTGLTSPRRIGTGLPLQQALEQLFQNITISLMSSSELQPDEVSAFLPPLTEVKFSMRNNVYIYAAYKLWLSYGLAIALSTVVVIYGLIAIYMNDASYSDDFSALLRLCRGAQLRGEINRSDLDGKDPRPAYLAATEIRFVRSNRPSVLNGENYLPVSKEQCKNGDISPISPASASSDQRLVYTPSEDAVSGASIDGSAWGVIRRQ